MRFAAVPVDRVALVQQLTARRALAGVVLAALALGGCGGGSNALSINPSSTIVTVENAAGTPLAGIPVTLSTGITGTTPTGIIGTQTTNSLGFVTFGLGNVSNACVSAAPAPGPAHFLSYCKAAPFAGNVLLKP